jgi:prepilin signal peptidase PulO-like enzyme (type II secretory pathway)
MDFLHVLPLWYQYTIVGVFGAIVGSFLNVYIYRFHTGKSLSGRSHCLSCGRTLTWFELVPLFSYLTLRGRCRTCRCGITARYFIVELLTGLLFIAAYSTVGSLYELLFLMVALSLLVVITVYDINHYIIPDILTAALTAAALLWYGVRYAVLGESLEIVGLDVLGSLLGVGFFYLLWFMSQGRWIGFGDVKLAFPLGLMVGISQVFSMIVFSFWIGAAVSLCLVGLAYLQRGKLRLHLRMANLTIKSVVPFAPFMIAGCLLVLFTHLNVLSLFTI